jgi:hypothetical protein
MIVIWEVGHSYWSLAISASSGNNSLPRMARLRKAPLQDKGANTTTTNCAIAACSHQGVPPPQPLERSSHEQSHGAIDQFHSRTLWLKQILGSHVVRVCSAGRAAGAPPSPLAPLGGVSCQFWRRCSCLGGPPSETSSGRADCGARSASYLQDQAKARPSTHLTA